MKSTVAVQIDTGTMPAEQPGPPRPLPAGEGWNLPERRKFRFRLEDVAFD